MDAGIDEILDNQGHEASSDERVYFRPPLPEQRAQGGLAYGDKKAIQKSGLSEFIGWPFPRQISAKPLLDPFGVALK
jgi:hypothetical protein